MATIHYLTTDDILRIHNELVKHFETEGDPIVPAGPRDKNLVPSAASRPQTSLGGIEEYKTVEAKAAAMFHSLVTNHPFHNGNKRTALVSLLVFLDRHERRLDVTDDDLFAFVLAVANNDYRAATKSGHADEVVDILRRWISHHTTVGDHNARGMKSSAFLKKCESAGASYRLNRQGGTWIVRGPNKKSVKISKATLQLDGKVIKRYMQMLGLSAGVSGIHFDEFQKGTDPEQQLIRRFRAVLRRLANA